MQFRAEFSVALTFETVANTRDGCLGKNQFTDNVHEQIQLVDIDPNGTTDRTGGVLGNGLNRLLNGRSEFFWGRGFKNIPLKRRGRLTTADDGFDDRFVPSKELNNLIHLFIGTEDDLKSDAVGQISRGREGADDFTVFFQQIGHSSQIQIKTAEVKIDLDLKK